MRKIVLNAVVMCSLSSFSAYAQEKIAPGSKIYIHATDGFDTYLTAALERKKVPVRVVELKDKADYELSGVSDQQTPGWAKMLVLGQLHSDDQASIKLVGFENWGGCIRILRQQEEYFAWQTNGG